jgi:hypothetical protein
MVVTTDTQSTVNQILKLEKHAKKCVPFSSISQPWLYQDPETCLETM